MIATDFAIGMDPVLLAERAGIGPDDWQADLLRSDHERILLNCSRQSGKSTMAAVIGLHTALYEPESPILIVSRALRQSVELFRKVLATYRILGRPAPAEAETKLTLELENGSRIISLPGKEDSLRSFSGVKLLILDEASRIPDETYFALRPMLAVSGGRLIALSTPFGKRGWWHEAYVDGGAGWQRFEVPASQCPRISAGFLAGERRDLPPWVFQQEYECQFSDNVAGVFSFDDIAAMLDSELKPLFGGLL